MSAPHKSVTGNEDPQEQILRLQTELDDLRKELDLANQRLQKRSVERQLARNAADSAYKIVNQQNAELIDRIDLFRKFVPDSLSSMLDQKGFDVSKGMSLERTYSVLSTDIRNFTSFTEKMSCQECFKFLNSFFTVMEPGIRNEGGFVYQYVGDSIMALFPSVDGHSDNAVESALHLLNEVIPGYNKGRDRAGYDTIQIGIGINSGSVATGIAGTAERMDVSAFGSTVNLAARCEGLTKELGEMLIVTNNTHSMLSSPDSYETLPLGEMSIRGMEKRVDLYSVKRKGKGVDQGS
jgi:class 3 adenylate cyclase